MPIQNAKHINTSKSQVLWLERARL